MRRRLCRRSRNAGFPGPQTVFLERDARAGQAFLLQRRDQRITLKRPDEEEEIAAAAEIVMGKASGLPVAVVRGVDPTWLGEGNVHDEIIRHPSEDLFR